MRVLTRPDLDGLTCAVLLKVVEAVDEVIFVEPHPFQTGQIEVRATDIVANLPYHPGCGKWFDHHASNALPPGTPFVGAFHVDPSAARTIFNHYQDPRLERYRELLEATDKVDSAQLSLEDVLNPEGYVLLSLTLDPRSNIDTEGGKYFYDLLAWLATDDLSTLLSRPAVAWRTQKLLAEQEAFRACLQKHSFQDGNVVITDFRALHPQPVGSRFLVYALFPTCDTSIKAYPAHKNPGHVGLSIGHSIFLKTQTVSAGALCAQFGGGGHVGAGSCVVKAEVADEILQHMRQALRRV